MGQAPRIAAGLRETREQIEARRLQWVLANGGIRPETGEAGVGPEGPVEAAVAEAATDNAATAETTAPNVRPEPLRVARYTYD